MIIKKSLSSIFEDDANIQSIQTFFRSSSILSFLVYLLTLQLIDIDSSAVTPINWSTSWLWQIGASEKTNKNSINVYYYTIKTMSRLGGFFKQALFTLAEPYYFEFEFTTKKRPKIRLNRQGDWAHSLADQLLNNVLFNKTLSVLCHFC